MKIEDTFQFQAADPEISCWVSASAGSGKTKVLIDRLTRLLLNGVSFNSILCITYTNAAAAEIKERLKYILYHFSSISEIERQEKLTQLLGRAPKKEELSLAKQLYLDFMEHTDAIRIQTIHSFCKDFLAALSFESGIYGNLNMMEEMEARNLLKKIQEDCLLQEEDRDFCENFAVLSRFFSFAQIDERLEAVIPKRYDFAELIKRYALMPKEDYQQCLEKWLEIDKEGRQKFDADAVAQIVHHLKKQECSESDNTVLDNLLHHQYAEVFLTKTLTLKKKILSSALIQKNPEDYEVLQKQAVLFYEQMMQQKSEDLIELTISFLNVVQVIFQKYQKMKEEMEKYDFEDLIMKTNALLEQAQLDLPIKRSIISEFPIQHLLIDEAQDTSPQQWQIVLQLVNTLFESSQTNTLFVVGDLKQSIYSFQGACPWLFYTLEAVFAKIMQNLGGKWKKIALQTSFRTAQNILDVVDDIFQTDDKGISFDHSYQPHISARKTLGLVRIIDVKKNDDEDKNEQLAQTITDCIQHILEQKIFLPSVHSIVRPEDILILVKRRTALIPGIIARLQVLNIAVEAPDKIDLSRNLIWRDLLAFFHFLVLPRDDYNLACLLKTPFMMATEEEVFELCSQRTGSLFDLIWTCQSPVAEKMKNKLKPYYEESQKLMNGDHAYMFFCQVLGGEKTKFQSIYGDTVELIFNAFLDEFFKLSHEKMFDLCEYLEILETQVLTVKNTNHTYGVRIMTVHGSKGLQSPIVILADTSDRITLQKEVFAWSVHSFENQMREFILLPPATLGMNAAQQIRQNALDEFIEEDRRLLYVAITRAQDALYSIGWKDNDASWHATIASSVRKKGEVALPDQQEEVPLQANVSAPTPSLSAPASYQTTLIPRVLIDAEGSATPQKDETVIGILIHAFITALTRQSFDLTTAEAWFKYEIQKLENCDSAAIFSKINIAALLKIAEQEEFQWIKKASHEVAFYQHERIYRLDHLYVDAEKAIIIEVKTTAYVPSSPARLKEAYEEQVRRYYEVVNKTFPKHKIMVYFLWTQVPEFMLFHV